jgi:hypothetical protein
MTKPDDRAQAASEEPIDVALPVRGVNALRNGLALLWPAAVPLDLRMLGRTLLHAAGMAAVFRTPLGAALLATEMLYRDDFEADALVPAILASVIAYSVVISAFGETTLFGYPPRFPFVPAHLPLYAVLALVVAPAGVLFLRFLRQVQRVSARLPIPVWARPAAGGLLMGGVGTAIVFAMPYSGVSPRPGRVRRRLRPHPGRPQGRGGAPWPLADGRSSCSSCCSAVRSSWPPP